MGNFAEQKWGISLSLVTVASPTLDVLELLSGKTHRGRITGMDPAVAATARAVITPDP